MQKKCSKCKEIKDISLFYKNNRSKDGLDGRCKICHEKVRLRYLTSDKGKNRRNSWLDKNKEHIKEYNEQYYKENRDFVLALNKDWRINNREKSNKIQNLNWHKRRERQNKINDSGLSIKEVEIIKNAFGNKCAKCGSKDKLQLDHHYPLNLGYALSVENAVILCIKCNASKCDKLPEDFYTQDELKIILDVISNIREKIDVV